MNNPARKNIDEICSRPPIPDFASDSISHQIPAAQPIHLAAAYVCRDPEQADSLLGGSTPGYVYQRDGHPNADLFAKQCRELHNAESAVITATGMSALGLAVLSFLQQGDQLVVSDRLYGRSSRMFQEECTRFGIETSVVDAQDLQAVDAACSAKTRMIVVETISNPLLKVADIPSLSKICKSHEALLLVDNTFATPAVCKPILFGADLVMESVSKMMNGHSDLMLGMLCGRKELMDRAKTVCSTWGFTSDPHSCWLASRGLATLHLRIQRASQNAFALAEFLSVIPQVSRVHFPGLQSHKSHQIACEIFNHSQSRIGCNQMESTVGNESVQSSTYAERKETRDEILFGNIVTFQLNSSSKPGLRAKQFIEELGGIQFVPSLGGNETTISHPASTSHRHLNESEQQKLGICPECIRVSVGIESEDFVLSRFRDALTALDG